MTALQLAVLGTMIAVAGVMVAVAALRPAPPSLTTTMTQLRAAPAPFRYRGAAVAVPVGRHARVETVLARMSGRVRDTDLAITGKTRAQVTVSRFGLCLAALFTPTLFGVMMAVAGLTIPVVMPAGVGLALAVVAWFVQEQSLHDDAEKLRAEFVAALTSYLSLVALERQVRGSPVEALEEAARLSQTWPFRAISTELVRAEMSGQAPWDGLRDLGHRIGVERLQSLADIVAAADDGAGVFTSLRAEARSLRAAEAADALTRANVVSEQLGQPLAILALANLVLGMLPALLRLLNS
ncbi:MAG: hypothetical protein WAL50_18185 [Kineosporiaceae bacterium]